MSNLSPILHYGAFTAHGVASSQHNWIDAFPNFQEPISQLAVMNSTTSHNLVVRSDNIHQSASRDTST